jgi:RNA polymerase sigma-70 factor (ECF subfamily)
MVTGMVFMGVAAWSMARQDPVGARSMEQSVLAGLISRVAVNRDRDAFARLFDHFAPRLKSFMMRKGASPDAAEDLVQEAMIAVWTKCGLYAAEKGSVATWVFTIARNLRIDRLRRELAVPVSELGDYDEASDDPGSDELVSRAEEDRLVSRALTKIPSEQREVLILSYVEDVPQSEIAQRLQLPLGTVKSRMRLAYRRLRQALETVK